MRVRRFLHFLLLTVACLLVWQVVVTWRRPLYEAGPAAQADVPEEKPLPPAAGLTSQTGGKSAEAIADKDLFTPSRSRAVKENAPVATVPPPSHLKLVGVVLAPDREEAFFADSTQGGKVVRVRKGESLGSYRLAGVTPLQAILSLGQDGDEVSLPLLVLDSGTAAQGQRLLPAMLRQGGAAGRPGQGRQATPPARLGAPAPAAAPPPQNEAHAIRRNIQQLQQRLRQIRRQAARGDTTDEGDEEDEGNEGDEGDEE